MDVIKNKRIAFVHVSMLNDPFDPYFFFETDFEESYQNLIRFVRRNHPEEISRFRGRVTPKNWLQTVRELKEYMQTLRRTTFLLSASASLSGRHPKDNLYMWGHYANGHRGLAIEFETEVLASTVLEHHEAANGVPSNETNVWAKIIYSKTFNPISAKWAYEFLKQEVNRQTKKTAVTHYAQLDRHFERMLTIKSDVWESENEWRLMWQNSETNEKVYKLPIGVDTITSIFLGLSLAPEQAEELIAAARKNFPAASIFRAHKRHGDLALEFRQL